MNKIVQNHELSFSPFEHTTNRGDFKNDKAICVSRHGKIFPFPSNQCAGKHHAVRYELQERR